MQAFVVVTDNPDPSLYSAISEDQQPPEFGSPEEPGKTSTKRLHTSRSCSSDCDARCGWCEVGLSLILVLPTDHPVVCTLGGSYNAQNAPVVLDSSWSPPRDSDPTCC